MVGHQFPAAGTVKPRWSKPQRGHFRPGSLPQLQALARQADRQDLSEADAGQVPALLLLLHRRRTGAVLPACADVGTIQFAVLLHWPQCAGTNADARRHRVFPARQRFSAHYRPGACPTTGRRLQSRWAASTTGITMPNSFARCRTC